MDTYGGAIVVGASITRVEFESAIEIGDRRFLKNATAVVISGGLARIEFSNSIEIARRRLNLSFFSYLGLPTLLR
jgi:hypothetical protein